MTFGSPREDRQSASNFVPLERRVLAERSRRLSWLGCGSSMVYVDYHPATWRQRIKNTGGMAPGTGPGEILFHEMVHGYRMQCGFARDDKVAGHRKMDNIEEFYAILAANVYRSDRGFTALRTDHWGFLRLKKTDSYPEVFYKTSRRRSTTGSINSALSVSTWRACRQSSIPFATPRLRGGFMTAPLTPMRL
jgi:hypothetical protein